MPTCQICKKPTEPMDWHGESQYLGLLVCKNCYRYQQYQYKTQNTHRRPANNNKYYYEVPIVAKHVKGEGMKYGAQIAKNIPYLALEYKMEEGRVIIEVGVMGHNYLRKANYARLIEEEIK